MKSILMAVALLTVPGIVQAQTYKCSVPTGLPRPHAELATASEPQRILPIGGYTLAVTWAPQYCHTNARTPFAKLECGSGNRFGFTLHGLWPDGVGKEWPQYCKSAALLPQPLIEQHICATPSAQLLQPASPKHGTRMRTTPAAYSRPPPRPYPHPRPPPLPPPPPH